MPSPSTLVMAMSVNTFCSPFIYPLHLNWSMILIFDYMCRKVIVLMNFISGQESGLYECLLQRRRTLVLIRLSTTAPRVESRV